MNKVFNHLGELHDNLLAAFGRTTLRTNGAKDRLLMAFHDEHVHFNDGEEEEGPGLAFRGAVGFVTNRLFARMTIFNRSEDRRYAERAREEDERRKHMIAHAKGIYILSLEPELE